MRILLDPRLTVEQNAALYFERAKKAKKKLEGARKHIAATKERLAKKEETVQKEVKPKRKKAWYEQFRWFYSSEGFLCIGGKDAGSNENVVKKHMDKHDIVFHTDMAGSPFVIIKTEGKTPGKKTMEEAAQFTACYSRAWRMGLGYLDVFYVKPDQISKTAESGEFMPKGAFMIRGETKYFKPELELCIGKRDDGRVTAGPESAVLHHCGEGYALLQGTQKTSDVAKKLAKEYDVHPDEIIQLLPAGGIQLGRKMKILRDQ